MAQRPSPEANTDTKRNRDDDLRPDGEGRPPRHATQPKGGEPGPKAPTATNPATGEPNR
jgi:hypothetical protein